ncbi:PAS domain-containing protein [uncultured Croceicoccus sp.]|uniref:PAS domain-containing protein n=1 Tax=uncultured Croceicoccus sp. TaxID=1295329 RepID=UPI002604F72A|nr:PAS domain-containing protein [uncultured Croceicoccus sp.]
MKEKSQGDPLYVVSLHPVEGIVLSHEDIALDLLLQSEDCVKILGVDGTLEHVNCGGLRALEVSHQSEILGKIWWDIWPERYRAFVRNEFMEALGGTPRMFEAYCPTALGTPRYWSVSLKPLISRAGPVVSILCVSRDITEDGDTAEIARIA